MYKVVSRSGRKGAAAQRGYGMRVSFLSLFGFGKFIVLGRSDFVPLVRDLFFGFGI